MHLVFSLICIAAHLQSHDRLCFENPLPTFVTGNQQEEFEVFEEVSDDLQENEEDEADEDADEGSEDLVDEVM